MKDISIRTQMKLDVVEAFNTIIAKNDVSIAKAFELLHKSGAPRFYITPEYARKIVSLVHRGYDVGETKAHKAMYAEIYRRWVCRGGPKVGYRVVDDIVQEPAPEWYRSKESLKGFVYRTIRELRKNKRYGNK